jgi:hypothetical protein
MSLTEARCTELQERIRATPLASVTRRGGPQGTCAQKEVWNEGVSLQVVAKGSI